MVREHFNRIIFFYSHSRSVRNTHIGECRNEEGRRIGEERKDGKRVRGREWTKRMKERKKVSVPSISGPMAGTSECRSVGLMISFSYKVMGGGGDGDERFGATKRWGDNFFMLSIMSSYIIIHASTDGKSEMPGNSQQVVIFKIQCGTC